MPNTVEIDMSRLGVNRNWKSIFDDVQQRFVEALSLFAFDSWLRHAREDLRTTSEDYIAGIQLPEVRRNEAVIRLTGALPTAIELGSGAFDMKPGLLEGDSARITKDGKDAYTVVPFRKGTPKVTGRNFPGMPPVIYSGSSGVGLTAAKRLKPVEEVEGKVRWGGRLRGTERAVLPKLKRKVGTMSSPYVHTASIYEGMMKVKGNVNKRKRPEFQYLTMRTVSTRSNPNSWMHPGIKAANIIEKVDNDVRRNLQGVARSVGI